MDQALGSDIVPSPTDVPESLQEDDETDLSLLIDGGDIGGETLGNFLWSADPFDEAEDLEALFNPSEEDDTLADTSVWQQDSAEPDPDSWEEAVPAARTKLQAMNALRALSKTTSILGMGKKVLKDPGGSSSSAAFAEDYSGGNEAEGQEGGTRRASLWGKAQQIKAVQAISNGLVHTKDDMTQDDYEAVLSFTRLAGNDVKAGSKRQKQVHSNDTDSHSGPDLNVVYSPPENVLENLYVLVHQGEEQSVVQKAMREGRSFKLVATTARGCIAFKLVAKQRPDRTPEEEKLWRDKLMKEVDEFKKYLAMNYSVWQDFTLGDTPQSQVDFSPPHQGAASSVLASAFPQVNSNGMAMAGEWVRPTRTRFMVCSVATGTCQLFPLVMKMPYQAYRDNMVDILSVDTMNRICPYPFPQNPNAPQILEVIQKQNQKQKRKKDGTFNANARARCEFKLRIPGGGDKVMMTMWANGKTLTSGCKDRNMLIEANLCMANAILFAMRMPLPPGYPPLVHFNNVVPQLLLEPVRVLSAPLLGNWDTNLSSVGGRLDTTKVCSYLSRPQFAHQVAKVTAAKQGGCASRFQNLSLYIRKECLTLWPTDHAGQATVYINVYESGKCSMMSVPSIEVAEQVADVVTGLLLEAYENTSGAVPASSG